MATANDVLKVAASQIGVKETPSGSNHVKYNTEYYGSEVRGSAYPWCCVFVWWVFKHAGASKLFYDGKKVAYCPNVVNWAKRAGLWLSAKEKPKPGDIILYAKGNGVACHIGVVEKRISASYVQTIEGNTSTSSNDNGGAVMRRKRGYGSSSGWHILGFVRPKYGTGTTTASKPASSKPVSKPATSTSSGSAAIKNVQRWANEYANAGLTVDGEYGEKTRHGLVKCLQKALNAAYKCGLDVDGAYGAHTKKAVSKHNLKKGAKGDYVRVLQGALICHGYSTNGFDGDFGNGTLGAVKAFQKAHGLTADGIAGSATFTKLLG